MATLRLVIQIILLVTSVLMIAVVLMQQSKESGLGAAFGGETSSLSSKGRSASKEVKLRKLTVALAVIMGVLALIITALPGQAVI